MIVTKHAAKRWAQRFPGQVLANAFARARRPGKSVRLKLSTQLDRIYSRAPKHAYYLIARDVGAVFVCVPPEIIITTFPLTGNTDWKADR